MAIRANPHFNDPAFAQAASNLASLFAPPSGGDAAGWANARAKNEEASRFAHMYELAQSGEFDQQLFDRLGAAAGRWTPNQSYYAVDKDDATKRYGFDTQAATGRYGHDRTFDASRLNNTDDNARALLDRQIQEAAAMERLGVTDATARYGHDRDYLASTENNVRDNRRSVIGTLFGSLNPGQVRPTVPQEFMDALGLPEAGQVAGLPKPLSEDETKAAIFRGLPLEEQQAIVFGSTPVENVVTPEGPRVATRRDAVGQEPYINRGAEAKVTNSIALLPGGAQVPAVQRPGETVWRHAQTNEVLPENIKIFDTPKPQGTSEELGLSKPTNARVEQQLIDITVAKDTAVRLRDLVSQAPASQGMVGWLRGTAQNVIATGGELGTFFGGGISEVTKAIEDGAADAGLAGSFDPNIPARELLANLLAFQYAKTTTGERLSNEMLKTTRAALGLDSMTGNQTDTLARLDAAIGRIEAQEEILRRFRTEGVGGASAPSGRPTTRMRFDENGNPL